MLPFIPIISLVGAALAVGTVVYLLNQRTYYFFFKKI